MVNEVLDRFEIVRVCTKCCLHVVLCGCLGIIPNSRIFSPN